MHLTSTVIYTMYSNLHYPKACSNSFVTLHNTCVYFIIILCILLSSFLHKLWSVCQALGRWPFYRKPYRGGKKISSAKLKRGGKSHNTPGRSGGLCARRKCPNRNTKQGHVLLPARPKHKPRSGWQVFAWLWEKNVCGITDSNVKSLVGGTGKNIIQPF